MSTRFGLSMLAVILAVSSANVASAAYCGAVNYCSYGYSPGIGGDGIVSDGAATESADNGATTNSDSCTVMVSRKRVIRVPEQYTAYRTEYETVYEERKVNTVKYVRENRTRTVNYPVRRPVWETASGRSTTPSCVPCGKSGSEQSTTRS